MASEKEEYVESTKSLEGKYPRFTLEGEQDALLRFGADQSNSRILTIDGVEDDIGSTIEIQLYEDDGMIKSIRFPGAASKWKIERVSIRHEVERDLIYIRFRWFLRQEWSVEVEELDDDLVLDLDKKNRVIGFAITNASQHIQQVSLSNLDEEGHWIKIASFSDEFESLEAITAAKKLKKLNKKSLVAEASRATATPSPSFEDKQGYLDQAMKSGSTPPSSATSKRRRFWNGRKINLLPQTVKPSTLETFSGYYCNRFVRDLDWIIHSPFILRPTNAAKVDIVDNHWLDLGESSVNFLSNIDRNPHIFVDWIAERTARSNNLGGYFALLLEFLHCHSKRISELYAKYQMFDDEKKTLGDFDFLMKDSLLGWIHWEVGIKFYLLNSAEITSPSSESWPLFIGPHCTGDSLEKYLNKSARQLELSQLPEVASTLKDQAMLPSKASLFLKGHVFFPLTQDYYTATVQDPIEVTCISGNAADPVRQTEHLRLIDPEVLAKCHMNYGTYCGWWARYSHIFPYNELGEAADSSDENLDLIAKNHSLDDDILLLETPPVNDYKINKLKHSLWTILSKVDYMAPILVSPDRSDIQLLSYNSLRKAIKMCFATNFRSLFVAEVIPYAKSRLKHCPNPNHVTHVEISRGFVVGSHWPSGPCDVILDD